MRDTVSEIDLTDGATRREFLKGAAWTSLAAVAAGAYAQDIGIAGGALSGAPMQGFRCKPMEEIRVGFIGVGSRGTGSVRRLAILPGVRVTAICDWIERRVAAANDWRVRHGLPKAKEYSGPEGYKRLCADPDVDVVYSVTNWESHHAINMCAMLNGKHMFTEMPGALRIEELWEEVETSEKTRRHCMMLENCCYGENEMLALNMVRMGLFGEIVHGEGGYVHDQRKLKHLMHDDDPDAVMIVDKKEVPAVGPGRTLTHPYATHHGNYYPTHGLGPIARMMNVNRGDRMEYLVSLESKQASLEAYG